MNRVALLIGNDRYDHLRPLKTAERDIAAVSDTLRQAQFEVKSLLDANRREMNQALREFSGRLRAGAAGIFWFAGHGGQFDNHNFLLPVDFKPIAPEYLEDDAVGLDHILKALGHAGADPLLLFIDACREDLSPYFRTYHRSMGPGIGFADLRTPPHGLMVVFSAGIGELALDTLGSDDTNPNSLFTREVLPFLQQKGMTIRDAIYSAREAIWQKAKSIGYNQTPAIYDQSIADFILDPIPQMLESTPHSTPNLFVQEAFSHISVFLSHSPGDRDDAARCAAVLEKTGFSVFLHSNSGERSRDNSAHKIADSHFFLPLITDHSLSCEGVQRDLGLALHLQQLNGGYRPAIIPIFDNASVWPPTGVRPTHLSVRDFDSGEETTTFNLDVPALSKYGSLTSNSTDALLALMRPSLLVSRYNFCDEQTFYSTGVFDLYETLFPAHERDSPSDIIRWVLYTDLGQVRQVPLRAGAVKYQINSRYFIMTLAYFIMTLAGRAVGLGFFTYDYCTNLVYGNYIAVEQNWRGANLAKSFLDKTVTVLGELFPQYRGIVFEVETLDRSKLVDTISYLEQQSPTNRNFRSEQDLVEIRKFLRIFWYQNMECDFFKKRGCREPLACTSPCLDPSSEDWRSQEDDYWIMWHKRPEMNVDVSDIAALWRDAVSCIYIEIVAKSLAEGYTEFREAYWSYANKVVNRSLRRARDLVLGRYLYRQDDDLMKRWVKLGIRDVAI